MLTHGLLMLTCDAQARRLCMCDTKLHVDTCSLHGQNKGADGHWVIMRYGGIHVETGWEQSAATTRSQATDLNSQEAINEIDSKSKQLMSQSYLG